MHESHGTWSRTAAHNAHEARSCLARRGTAALGAHEAHDCAARCRPAAFAAQGALSGLPQSGAVALDTHEEQSGTAKLDAHEAQRNAARAVNGANEDEPTLGNPPDVAAAGLPTPRACWTSAS